MKVFEAIKNVDYFIITKEHQILAGDTHTGFFIHPTLTRLTQDDILNSDVVLVEKFPQCLGECLTNIAI